MSAARDFSTISPSAKSLLLLKSQTSLPYAKEAAELLFGAEAVGRAKDELLTTPGAELRRRHFELRARSVDIALAEVGASRVLELAAGLSFRGLAMAERTADVHYVDSDLANIVAIKSEIAGALPTQPLLGTVRFVDLNAVDAEAFRAAVHQLPPGPIAILHEGLLMYLDDEERNRLATNVTNALRERGGWWITADIYVRTDAHVFREERTKAFLEQHRVEEKKFASWGAAESFFTTYGFSVLKRSASSRDPQHARETWTLALC
jgi:O-methyltransferase involved in polyketide biosynthesis